MATTTKIVEWLPRQSAAMFYPTKKFVGRVFDADGKWLGETGKCATRESAQSAAIKLASQVSA